jgi:uncharacterized protein YebE (UPF0316 family)
MVTQKYPLLFHFFLCFKYLFLSLSLSLSLAYNQPAMVFSVYTFHHLCSRRSPNVHDQHGVDYHHEHQLLGDGVPSDIDGAVYSDIDLLEFVSFLNQIKPLILFVLRLFFFFIAYVRCLLAVTAVRFSELRRRKLFLLERHIRDAIVLVNKDKIQDSGPEDSKETTGIMAGEKSGYELEFSEVAVEIMKSLNYDHEHCNDIDGAGVQGNTWGRCGREDENDVDEKLDQFDKTVRASAKKMKAGTEINSSQLMQKMKMLDSKQPTRKQNLKTVFPASAPQYLISGQPRPQNALGADLFLNNTQPIPYTTTTITTETYNTTTTTTNNTISAIFQHHLPASLKLTKPSTTKRSATFLCFGSYFSHAPMEYRYCVKRHRHFLEAFRYNNAFTCVLSVVHTFLDVASYCDASLPFTSGKLINKALSFKTNTDSNRPSTSLFSPSKF